MPNAMTAEIVAASKMHLNLIISALQYKLQTPIKRLM